MIRPITFLTYELNGEESYDISDLEIYPFSGITEFIDSSIKACINDAFRGYCDHMDPEEYYVAMNSPH